jgi:hypothetical protein
VIVPSSSGAQLDEGGGGGGGGGGDDPVAGMRVDAEREVPSSKETITV